MSETIVPLDLQPEELHALRAQPDAPLVLDVREDWELATCCLDDAVQIPLGQLAKRYRELPQDRHIVTLCHFGRRSAEAAAFLRQHGFTAVSNLVGGIDAWARLVDSNMERY